MKYIVYLRKMNLSHFFQNYLIKENRMKTKVKSSEKKIQTILDKYAGSNRDSLIVLLQDIQDAAGYLSKDVMVAVANQLNVPVNKVYGVASFYNQFRFHPIGRYHISICRGTACHVKGSLTILEYIQPARPK